MVLYFIVCSKTQQPTPYKVRLCMQSVLVAPQMCLACMLLLHQLLSCPVHFPGASLSGHKHARCGEE